MKKISLTILLMTTWVAHSLAGTVVCSGTVDRIAFHSSDKVMLKLSSMDAEVFICSLSSVWANSEGSDTTDPATCRAMFDMLLSAKALGTPVNSMYFDGVDVPTACDQWGAWKSAHIRYFQR
jgi:hypothetical protein